MARLNAVRLSEWLVGGTRARSPRPLAVVSRAYNPRAEMLCSLRASPGRAAKRVRLTCGGAAGSQPDDRDRGQSSNCVKGACPVGGSKGLDADMSLPSLDTL